MVTCLHATSKVEGIAHLGPVGDGPIPAHPVERDEVDGGAYDRDGAPFTSTAW
jgi:hypothetical protein